MIRYFIRHDHLDGKFYLGKMAFCPLLKARRRMMTIGAGLRTAERPRLFVTRQLGELDTFDTAMLPL